MADRVNLKLIKKWGAYPKGHTIEGLKRSRARSIQDVRKVGKIIEPKADKTDPDATGKATK